MTFTPEESAALERLRRVYKDETKQQVYGGMVDRNLCGQSLYSAVYDMYISDTDCAVMASLRRFPVRKIGDLVIRWDDPVTPERLMASGWVMSDGDIVEPVNGLVWMTPETSWRRSSWRIGGAFVIRELEPKNMGEVWQLLDRAGVPIPGEVM